MPPTLKTFALDYNYSAPDYSSGSPTTTTTGQSTQYTLPSYANDTSASSNNYFSWPFMAVMAALIIFGIVVSWKVFTKAKQAGWQSLIPIYSTYIMLKIVGRPWWWLLLMLIPGVNFVISIIISIDLAKSFGKGVGYGLGLMFLSIIFYPMLAFGKATYNGPAAASK